MAKPSTEFGGKTIRPAAPSFPDRPMHPKFGRPEFPQEPRDPWPWISLILSIAALVVSVLVWFRT